MVCEGRQRQIDVVEERNTHKTDETVGMEGVLTWEDIELSREERLVADRTLLCRVDGDEALLQCGDILLDSLRVARGLIHLRLQRVDVRGVVLERRTYLVLEVINHYEVGEERQDVFDLQEVGVLEEAHGPASLS